MGRQEKTIHYLYKTTCLVTDRYYIGMHSTCNLYDGYIGSGKRLRYSMRKHGIENHVKEILEFFDTRELLVKAENKAITPEMILDNNCMNLMCGGQGGFISEEQQRHRAICARKANEEKRCDLIWFTNYKKNMSIAQKNSYENGTRKRINVHDWTGLKHTEETRIKMVKSKNVGRENSQYGTCWITKEGLNKKIKKEDLDSFISEGWIQGRK